MAGHFHTAHYSTGKEALADGAFTSAHQVDPGLGPTSRRLQRDEELRPQQRLAAVLGGREQLDACETLLLSVVLSGLAECGGSSDAQ